MSLTQHPPHGRIEILTGPMFCHRKGERILMANGRLISVEDIKPGDRVMGVGGWRTVVSTHSGVATMCEIQPNRGEPAFYVTEHHLLTLKDTPQKRDGKPSERGGRIVDVPVKEWMGWSKFKKGIFKLFRAPMMEFDAPDIQDVDLDPYFLGMMLGDGSLDGRIGLTCKDQELWDVFENVAKDHGLSVSVDNDGVRCESRRIVGHRGVPNPIADKFRKLGLYGATGDSKFIPPAYKTASRQCRLHVLAGLIDTDGHVDGKGGIEFTNKSERLADDAVFLARSLGLYAKKTSVTKHCQTGGGGTYYEIYIGGDIARIPTRIPRKKPVREVRHDPMVTGFQVKVLQDPEPFFGFTLDGDGRYVMGNFIVTHNSGKTEELIRRLRRAKIAKQEIAVFKPHIDTRFVGLGSHSKQEFPAYAIHKDTPQMLLDMVGEAHVVGIEEAQFFAPTIVQTIQILVERDKRVIVAGLDMDAWGRPFGSMPVLMALAEQVNKYTAICTVCGEDATRSQKIVATGGLEDVGAADKYEARCRVHFTVP